MESEEASVVQLHFVFPLPVSSSAITYRLVCIHLNRGLDTLRFSGQREDAEAILTNWMC